MFFVVVANTYITTITISGIKQVNYRRRYKEIIKIKRQRGFSRYTVNSLATHHDSLRTQCVLKKKKKTKVDSKEEKESKRKKLRKDRARKKITKCYQTEVVVFLINIVFFF